MRDKNKYWYKSTWLSGYEQSCLYWLFLFPLLMVFTWFAEISVMSVSLPAQYRWIGLILHCKGSWCNETWAVAAPGMHTALTRSAEEFWLCLTRQEWVGESLKHMDEAQVPLHLTPEESFWFGPFIDFITYFSMSLNCSSVLGLRVFLPRTSQVSRKPLFERHSNSHLSY